MATFVSKRKVLSIEEKVNMIREIESVRNLVSYKLYSPNDLKKQIKIISVNRTGEK
jgi:hypothetical protein